MKYVILVPDGMADLPVEEFGDRTCMEVANAPNMNAIAASGVVGLAKTIPRGMTPASDVANLSILGYAPDKYYCGRGPLEAANLGVTLEKNDVAFRFNFVTVSDDMMIDYSAGHITKKEGAVLTGVIQKVLGSERFSFYPGTSYRNLLVVHCKSAKEAEALSKVKCYPPHDILDKSVSKHLPKQAELVELMEKANSLLESHDINRVRTDLGQNPANMIWFWGQGKNPDMPTFEEAYSITGGIISAVDLLKGLGRILGLEVAEVPGATGYYDTNYKGKGEAALDILKRNDMVFVHVEATDEAGHNGDLAEKVKAIERFDRDITGPIMKELSEAGEPYRVLIMPDHPTPAKKRTHTTDPVPFAIAGTGVHADDVVIFSERAAKAGSLGVVKGSDIMGMLIGGDNL